MRKQGGTPASFARFAIRLYEKVFGEAAVPVNEKVFENSIPNPANRGSMIWDALGNIDEGTVKAMTSAASTSPPNDMSSHAMAHNECLRHCMVSNHGQANDNERRSVSRKACR